MKNILIFGNSGSGKSTLAKQLSQSDGLAHLDLDTLAWQAGSPPQRMPLEASQKQIELFLKTNKNWVIEGCYSDLLELVLSRASQIIFMDLPLELCIENAKSRPWEPHKYQSKEAQDANLDMLIDWIAQYTTRNDTFSYASHAALFEQFQGDKLVFKNNERE